MKQTPPNNGQFAKRFEERSNHLSGSKTSSAQPDSQMTQLRSQAMQSLYDLANKKGLPLDQVVTQVLTNSDTVLKNYIQSKGETPVPDPVGRAVQATLLRAGDIATTASILDISDEDALKSIESAESDIVNANSPDQDSLLDIPTQAAIACALEYMSSESGKTMGQLTNGVQMLAKNYKNKANNDDGSDDIDSWLDWSDDDTDSADPATAAASTTDVNLSPVSIGSSLASIPVSAPSSIASGIPTISTSASTAAQVNSSTQSGGVLNSLSGILSGISQVASQVTSAAGSVNSTSSAIQKALGGVGASSIQQYVQNNAPMLIVLVIVVLLVIWFAIRGRK